MTVADLVLTVVSTVVGAAVGWAVSYYFFRRGSARPRLRVELREQARIDPRTVGLDVDMMVGTYKISNLIVFELSVHNSGPGDMDVPDAADSARHALRPRVELPAQFKALADPWNPDGAVADADMRVARTLTGSRQALHIHIHRLAAGATSRALVLCTYRSAASAPTISARDIGFFPGFYPNIDIEPAGLLRNGFAQSLRN